MDREPPVMDRSAAGIALHIRLAREGKAEALSTLLEAYRNYLRILAATCIDRDVRGKTDASDAVQEALIKAHQNFHQFRGTTEQEWITWVRRILVNTLTDLHRKFSPAGRRVSRERSLESSLDHSSLMLRNLVAAPGASPSQEAQTREMSVVLADALADLDPEYREVVVLRSLQELPWNEIGERTGRTPDAARMLWTRAMHEVGVAIKRRVR
jgi:RNA polymerase sigma-70 factor (ECF subfamily)